ncbi:MAG TPA: HIT family protein [Phycisphaerae bacterium]|nr:HIT family protein [Phycisphaerae bacterium]
MSEHPTDPGCIFCKIVAGQIPSFKVYEDDTVFAFLDIGPLVRGHTLVVPKAHHATVMEAPPEVLAGVNARMPRLARAVLAATGASACHVLVNNGPEAMQSVSHLHYHIIPRREGDRFSIPWNPQSLDKAEAPALVSAMERALRGAGGS